MSGERSIESCVRAAGQYSLNIIHHYLNDIHAAAYPQTPSQVGGPLYDSLNSFYNDIAALMKVQEDPYEIALQAVDMVRYTDDSKQGSEFAKAFFAAHRGNVDKLMSGVSPEELLDFLKTPQDPSSPGPK